MTPRPTLPDDLRGLNVRDLFEASAAANATRPFLITRDRSLSYGEIDLEADRAAAAWQELGVVKGDRVAVMADNSPELVAAWLGLAKAGAVMVAINTRFKAAEVRYVLDDVRPSHILGAGAHVATLHDASAGREPGAPLLTLGGASPDQVDFLLLMERAAGTFDRPELLAEDPVSFILTSGTTGRPKAVIQTHGNYVLTGQAYPRWLGLEPGDALYTCLPLFHVNAQAYSTMGAIALGSSLGLVERFSASRFWSDIMRSDARAFNYIGAMIAILMQLPVSEAERAHGLRVAYGAPSFPDAQRRVIEERFGITLMSGFAMSETTFGMVEEPYGDRRSGSVGKPRFHPDERITNEARVVDDDGQDVADDVVGELLLRNPVTMVGYWGDPERTEEALRDGWLHTGDFVRRDADGFYYFIDRKKDIVRRRGENVSSLEVELVLYDHPGVQEAAVLGVPAELTEEDILAVVVPLPGADADAGSIVAWCTERLADFKVPRYVAFVDELPKTPTQKIAKARLRAELPPSSDWHDLFPDGRGSR